ncbi:MAG: DUF805 domain-containing protein [Candidatus Accumulibacter sp.]|nr:DUF805 domain-containing protein [Accumulibacter sp.]
MREAFVDALRNTFNLGGRTSRKGFWLFILSHFTILFMWYWMNYLMDIHLPEREGLLYIILAGFPSIALCFRRWHDISFPTWKGLLGVVLIFLFYFVYLDFVSYGLLFYFLFRFCQPSVEDNCYGKKPVDCLTTHPERQGLLQAPSIQAIITMMIALFFGWTAWIWNNVPGEVFSITKERKTFNRNKKWGVELSDSLKENRNAELSVFFGPKSRGKDARFILIPPYQFLKENERLNCLGYSAAFFEKLNASLEAVLFDQENIYRLVTFNSSGLIDEKILHTNIFCREIYSKWPACLKLNEATLIADTEENRNRTACYNLNKHPRAKSAGY